jgi:hypothetical protein
VKLYVDDCRPVPAGWELSLDFMIADRFQDNFAPVARHILTMPREKRPRLVHVHTSSPDGARLLIQILTGHVDEVRKK